MGILEQVLERLDAIEAKLDALRNRPEDTAPVVADEAPRWMDTKQAAAHVGLSHQSLALYRSQGDKGPPFAKVGKVVRYDRHELDRWLEEARRGG